MSSREILFRGKRIDNGEWVEGYYAKSGQDFILSDNMLTCGYLEMFEVDQETVCQYTELVDKNGRKIFEGDIVKIGLGQYEVWWNCDSSSLTLSSQNESRGLYLSHNETIEVIGNIFDNPELIS